MVTLRLGSSNSAPDSIAAPKRIADRYEVIDELGKGGMGTVYRVRHIHTGEQLALKLLRVDAAQNPELVERFRREMRASAVLRSENVARVTDADTTGKGGSLYLVMELLDGCDLYRLLQSGPPLSKEDTVWVLAQIGKALTKAHQAGIVHRDLKPENIFFHRSENGLVIKVLDFGIAYFRDASPDNSGMRVTQSHSMLGTPQYMAPEQLLAEHEKISTGTDFWAMGMLAYEVLSGKPYFQDLGLRQIIGKMTGGKMPVPSEKLPSLPAAFDAWFARSCAPEPGLRFATVTAQLEALTEALGVPPAVMYAAAPSAELRARLGAIVPSKRESSLADPLETSQVASVDVAVQQARKARQKKWILAALLLLLVPVGWLAFRMLTRERAIESPPAPTLAGPAASPAAHPENLAARPPSSAVEPEKPRPSEAAPTPLPDPGAAKAAAAERKRPRSRAKPERPQNLKDYNPVAP